MYRLPILVGLFVFGLMGCSDRKAADSQDTASNTEAPATAASTPPPAPPLTPGCIRAEPEALLAAGSNFVKSSPSEAVESTSGAGKLGFEIRHYGCTANVLELQFTWPQAQLPPLPETLTQAKQGLESLQFKPGFQSKLRDILTAFQPLIAVGEYYSPVDVGETDVLIATTPSPNVLVLRYEGAL
jgi:hypothetical protein